MLVKESVESVSMKSLRLEPAQPTRTQFQNPSKLPAQAVRDPIAPHDFRLQAAGTKINTRMEVNAERGEASTDSIPSVNYAHY